MTEDDEEMEDLLNRDDRVIENLDCIIQGDIEKATGEDMLV